MDEVWVEKYRPRKLSEIVGQKEITERLISYVRTKNLPHLLFAGTAGTGKTTSAIALARELYGEESWRLNFQEMNASDERGIDVVRTKIKDFARTATMGNFPFKIIFLDEADALTPDAQSALRRTMEKYTQTCRFILSCNYSSKIIDPIQSRCAVFRFRPLKAEDIKARIREIASKENVSITEDGLDALIYVSGGDLRKAINSLQVGAVFGEKITGDTLYRATATARPDDIKKLIALSVEGKFIEAREKLDELLINYGLSGEDIVRQIHKTIFDLGIPDEMKVDFVERLGEAEFRIIEGSNDRIQLESLLAYFAYAGKKYR